MTESVGITEKALEETTLNFVNEVTEIPVSEQQESASNEGENLSVLSTIELGDENSFISVLVSPI